MQRVIGMDIHRTFAEVVFWEAGRLRPAGRIDMTRSGLEGFGRSLEQGRRGRRRGDRQRHGGGAGAQPYVARVIVANPLQVKAIAHAHVKTTRSTLACWRRCGRGLPAGGLAARCGHRARRRLVIRLPLPSAAVTAGNGSVCPCPRGRRGLPGSRRVDTPRR